VQYWCSFQILAYVFDPAYVACFQTHKGERYRFKVILSELLDTNNLEYHVALLAFVNCLIISVPQLKDRIRVRNEFLGLKLHDVLATLQ
jgi:inverted formin-2